MCSFPSRVVTCVPPNQQALPKQEERIERRLEEPGFSHNETQNQLNIQYYAFMKAAEALFKARLPSEHKGFYNSTKGCEALSKAAKFERLECPGMHKWKEILKMIPKLTPKLTNGEHA